MKSRFLFTSPESLPAGVIEVYYLRATCSHFPCISKTLSASSGKDAESCLAHMLSVERKSVKLRDGQWVGKPEVFILAQDTW